MSGRQRLVNLAIAAVIAVVAIVVIVATSGGDDESAPESAAPTATPQQEQAEPAGTAKPAKKPEPTPTPDAVAIEVKDGEVVGGIQEIEVNEGDDVRFTVTADVADEVHVHAYDFMKDVEPGKTVSFDFIATITGITEIELEDAGLQIAELRVEP